MIKRFMGRIHNKFGFFFGIFAGVFGIFAACIGEPIGGVCLITGVLCSATSMN